MRTSIIRRHSLLVVVATGLAAACSIVNKYDEVVPDNAGGTNTKGGSQGTDGGQDNQPTAGNGEGALAGQGGAGHSQTVLADINATADFVGLELTLDGSGSSAGLAEPLTYAWSIDSVPDGSSITTASLSSASDAAPTFTPDLSGDYVVTLTVTNANDETHSTSVTLAVPAFDVPYFAVSGNATGSTRTPSMVKSDGTGAKDLGCFFTEAVSGNDETNWLKPLAEVGQFDIDSFYSSDPMQPSRLVFARADPAAPAGGPGARFLQFASSDTDCDQNKPPEISGRNLPRFSPNGKRVAFFTGLEVVTATSTGTGVRIVRPIGVNGDHALTVAPPFWIDDSTVAWLEIYIHQTFKDQVIYTAPDEAGGFNNQLKMKTLVNCGEVVSPFTQIRQVGMSKAGLVISALPTAAATTTSLFLLEEVTTDKYSCARAAVSNVRISGTLSDSQDFEISPDGTQVLFMRRLDDTATDVGPLATELYVVPADGSEAPTKLYGDGTDANNGARWAADGKQIVWSRNLINNKDPMTQRPQRSFLMIMNADGSNPRELMSSQSNVGTARAILTGANGCAIGGAGGSVGGGAGAIAMLLGLGLWLRRRG